MKKYIKQASDKSAPLRFGRRAARYLAAVITSVSVAFAMSFAFTPSYRPAEAASERVLFSGGVKKVVGKYVISSDRELPAGATLNVRDGAQLYIKKGATLTVNGKINIFSGGKMFVQGNVVTGEGSRISDSGRLKIQKTGKLSLGGTLLVNKKGTVAGQGTLEVLNSFYDIDCRGSVTAKIKAPAPVEKDGLTTVGGVLIVNRQFSVPEDYGDGLDETTYNAYLTMREKSGYDMTIVSGFRSYEKQKNTFAYWAEKDGWEEADRYSAQPGHSEHQTGLAMDISSLSQSYGETAEGKWLAAHCWEYGFLLRYPQNSEHITGYIYEPWHVRYLGESTAKLVHDSGLTLEEFLGVA